jgi:hypothetical protein
MIHDGLSRITKVSVKSKVPGDESRYDSKVFDTPFEGFGLYFEADAVARDLRGKARAQHWYTC